jgi:phosphate transport system substrate-binding protein
MMGIVWLLAALIAGCAVLQSRKSVIRMAGSDTMLPLNRSLAAAFEQENPDWFIVCRGGETGAGMQALLAGKVDICAASRPIAPEEVRALAARYHSIGMAHFVCKDALEIYLHPQNRIASLQTGQLRAIFSGAIANWRQVGGEDRPIHLYIRSARSGTRRYFAEHLLRDIAYSPEAIEVDTNTEMARRIALDPGGIGYGGNAFREGVKVCNVDGIAPVPDRVRDGTYPLSRYLYYYTIAAPQGQVKEFIDWVISPDVQSLIEEAGYYPIWQR